MEKLYVIIDKETKRVQGFTRYEEYVSMHPECELVEITEDSEVWLSETPRKYVWTPNGFVISEENDAELS